MLLLAAVLAALAAAATPAPMQIYKSALAHLETLQQPSYIDTTQHWNALTIAAGQEIPSTWDERVLFDSTARRECVLSIPYTSARMPLISDSYFAPDMWLIHHPVAPRPSGQSDFTPDLSDLRTIAAVVSVAKPSYDVHFAGIDSVSNGGGSAYHLQLHPIGDPIRHNLRELWVNTKTDDIVRAVLVGYYRPDNEHVVQLTTVAEDFGRIGRYWLVLRHTWSYHDVSSGATNEYDASTVQVAFPSMIPAWYFDSAQFLQHRTEVNTTADWP